MFNYSKYMEYALKDVTTIRITKSTHKDLLKVMGKIQAKSGEIPTLDDALKELLANYKKKSKKLLIFQEKNNEKRRR